MPLAGNQAFMAVPAILTAQGGADVAVAAGTNTTALSINGASASLAAQNPGAQTLCLVGGIVISLGATAPTALTVSYGIVLGTNRGTITVPVGALVANANLFIPLAIVDGGAVVNWQAGATPLIYINAVAQAVTVRLNGSQAICWLAPSN